MRASHNHHTGSAEMLKAGIQIRLPDASINKTPKGSRKISRRVATCMTVLATSLLTVSSLEAGPKYRAFQHNKPKMAQAAEYQRISVVSRLHGEVTDSPPIYIDGEFTTIAQRKISSGVKHPPQPSALKADSMLPATERHYQIKTNSLRYGLARMAALYLDLRQAR